MPAPKSVVMTQEFGTPVRRTFSEETGCAAFAAQLAQRLRPGDVVTLSGPIGAGKTTFVREIVRSLQGCDPTSSPTFTFWHHYPGQPPVEHLDLYRIEDPAQAADLGLEAAFSPDSIVLVEWPEHAPGLLPAVRFHIDIDGSGEAQRTITVSER